ncbi:MAG: DUF805 domain-containing protein [Pseudomonadota bacterium]
MFEAVGSCFSKYVVFSGRAKRPEYWWFYLFNVLVSVVLNILSLAAPLLGILGLLYSLGTFLPTLAVTWRRMHDIGRPGYHGLLVLPVAVLAGVGFAINEVVGGILALLAVVAAIVVLVWLASPSQPGANEYGGEDVVKHF